MQSQYVHVRMKDYLKSKRRGMSKKARRIFDILEQQALSVVVEDLAALKTPQRCVREEYEEYREGQPHRAPRIWLMYCETKREDAGWCITIVYFGTIEGLYDPDMPTLGPLYSKELMLDSYCFRRLGKALVIERILPMGDRPTRNRAAGTGPSALRQRGRGIGRVIKAKRGMQTARGRILKRIEWRTKNARARVAIRYMTAAKRLTVPPASVRGGLVQGAAAVVVGKTNCASGKNFGMASKYISVNATESTFLAGLPISSDRVWKRRSKKVIMPKAAAVEISFAIGNNVGASDKCELVDGGGASIGAMKTIENNINASIDARIYRSIVAALSDTQEQRGPGSVLGLVHAGRERRRFDANFRCAVECAAGLFIDNEVLGAGKASMVPKLVPDAATICAMIENNAAREFVVSRGKSRKIL